MEHGSAPVVYRDHHLSSMPSMVSKDKFNMHEGSTQHRQSGIGIGIVEARLVRPCESVRISRDL